MYNFIIPCSPSHVIVPKYCHVKVRDFGISAKLGIWLHSLLLNRSQFVRIPGGFKTDSQVIRRVPHGTVLGPLLFLILMSDINKGGGGVDIFSRGVGIFRERLRFSLIV